MEWEQIPSASPLRMSPVLAFMELWQPGSTQALQPGSKKDILAFAEPHGGPDSLPWVYLEFLETMGESCGALAPNYRSFSLKDLLTSQKSSEVDPARFVKVSVGEEDYNGRQPDDFLDLAAAYSDGADAALIRILESDLLDSNSEPDRPYASFSDMIRTLAVVHVAFGANPERRPLSIGFGAEPASTERVYKFAAQLGFRVSDLGASKSVLALEDEERGAIGLLIPASHRRPGTTFRFCAKEERQEKLIQQLLAENQQTLSGL